MGRIDGASLSMLLLVVIWGTAFVGLKDLALQLTPLQIMWLRYVPFLLGFVPWLVWKRWATLKSLDGTAWRDYLLMAALAVPGYHIPVNVALSQGPGAIDPATGAIVIAATPICTLLIESARNRQRPRPAKLIGALIGFAGVLTVLLGAGGELRLTRGASIILLAPLLWGAYSVVAKPYTKVHGGMFLSGLSMSLGAILVTPLAFLDGPLDVVGWTTRTWVWLVYVSVLATALGYSIWNSVLQRKEPTQVAVFIFLVPVVATVAQFILLDQIVGWSFVFGSALVILGVATVQRPGLVLRLLLGKPRPEQGS